MSPEEMYTEKELELLRMRQDTQSRAAPDQLQRNSSTEMLPSTGVGVPVNQLTPNPSAPNMARMVRDTATSQEELKKESPPLLSDDQQKMAAGAGGLALLGWLASKFMGGDDNTPPDDNNPPNNRKGPKSRDIRREPQMDTTVKGPQEPMLLPETKVAPAPTPAPTPQLPQATISGQQQPQMQYGQTTLNAPTGTPNPLPAGPAAPPVEANAAIAPKPIDPVTQARIDSIAAAERRKEALHELELEEKKLRIETAKQKSQGQPVSQYSNDEKQMNQRSQEAKVNKEIIAVNNKTKATTAANVEKALVTAADQAAPIPKDAVPVPAKGAVAAVAQSANEISLPKEWTRKGMGWISSAYGIEGAQQFINQYNDGKPFKSHDEMKKVYDKVMTEPKFSTMPKEIRKERGIQRNAESQQYKIVPGGILPPTLPSGGGGGMVVPRGGVGNIPGANEQLHTLNPLKL